MDVGRRRTGLCLFLLRITVSSPTTKSDSTFAASGVCAIAPETAAVLSKRLFGPSLLKENLKNKQYY